MNIGNTTWKELVDRVQPATVPSEEVQELSLQITNGGIRITTVDPMPTPDLPDMDSEDRSGTLADLDKLDERIEEMAKNETVPVYDSLGLEIKKKILNRVDKSIITTPDNSSQEIIRCVVNKDGIYPTVQLRTTTTDSMWIQRDLCSALVKTGYLQDPNELAYANVDLVYQDNEEWRFNGKVYRYTERPYKYLGSDYPTTMDEWIEFASDNKQQKKVLNRRDRYIVHFHVSEEKLSEENPLIQWYKSAERYEMGKYLFRDDFVNNLSLQSAGLDGCSVNLTVSVVL